MSEWTDVWVDESGRLILCFTSGGQGVIDGNKAVQLNCLHALIRVCAGPSGHPGEAVALPGKSGSVSHRRTEGVLRQSLLRRPSCPLAPLERALGLQE